jgi:hypothetical protein
LKYNDLKYLEYYNKKNIDIEKVWNFKYFENKIDEKIKKSNFLKILNENIENKNLIQNSKL